MLPVNSTSNFGRIITSTKPDTGPFVFFAKFKGCPCIQLHGSVSNGPRLLNVYHPLEFPGALRALQSQIVFSPKALSLMFTPDFTPSLFYSLLCV